MKKRIMLLAACCLSALVFCLMIPSAQADEPVSYEEAFGAAAGMSLYNTQVILGITADSSTKQIYTSERAISVIKEQESLLELLRSYSSRLIQSPGTTPADKASLQAIVVSTNKLNETASALIAYINNPTTSNADTFQVKRKASYAEIAKLLGIEQPAQ